MMMCPWKASTCRTKRDDGGLSGAFLSARGGRQRTNHKQRLAKRSCTLPENLVRVEGDDVAEGEDEGVDVSHVQVVGGDGVRDRVLGKDLGLLNGVSEEEKEKRPDQ
jgi:hypothetical protein